MSFLGARPDSFQYGSTAYDHFSGDGVTTTFNLSRQVSANADIEVVVNNVIQDPGVAYSVSNLTTLTFTGAPTAGTNNIYVVYRQFVQSGIAPGANTVTMSAIAANTIQPWQLSNSLLNPLVSTFTGDGSTVAFTLTQAAVSSNSCYVTINGITQGSPANYSTNGATLTFTSAPASNSTIRVVQNSVVGTSIVPVDGSVTNTKLASNLTLTGSTILPIISGNTSITGSIKANNGLYSSNNFTGTYTDGIVMDYVTGNGRISVGGGDGLTFYNGGPATTALMTIANTGYIGIGTTNPVYKLDVRGSSQFGDGNHPTSATTNELWLSSTNNLGSATIGAYAGSSLTQAAMQAYDGYAQLNTNKYWTFLTNGSEHMRLDSDGNLGIGTTTPGAKLDVEGASLSQTGFLVQKSFVGGASGAITAAMYGTDSGIANTGITVGLKGASTGSFLGYDAMALQVLLNGSAVMSVNGNGRVGIGTTNPSYLLDVQGGSIRGSQQIIATGTSGTFSDSASPNSTYNNVTIGATRMMGQYFNATEYHYYKTNPSGSTPSYNVFAVSQDTVNWGTSFIMVDVYLDYYCGGAVEKYIITNQYTTTPSVTQIYSAGANQNTSFSMNLGGSLSGGSGGWKYYYFTWNSTYYGYPSFVVTTNNQLVTSITAPNQIQFV
jgi:hypothetical protein